jgi:uncharacterized membrane protein (DUF485 family)
MTQGTGTAAASGVDQNRDIDWEAVERSPEFRELIRRKKAFVIPATAFFMAWYFGFVILCGYAPDFMGREFITDGLTVGYALALSQFLMTFVLAWMYLRRANRVFDPLAERAREAAFAAAPSTATSGRRFRRGAIVDEAGTTEEVSHR